MKTKKILCAILTSSILTLGVVGLNLKTKTVTVAAEDGYSESFVSVGTAVSYTKNATVSTGDLSWYVSSYQYSSNEFYLGTSDSASKKPYGFLSDDETWTNELNAYKTAVDSSFDASSKFMFFAKTTAPTSFSNLKSVHLDWTQANSAGKMYIFVSTSTGYLTTAGSYASADVVKSTAGSITLTLSSPIDVANVCIAYAPTSASKASARLTNISITTEGGSVTPPPATDNYEVSVTNGTASETSVEAGATVTLTPTVPEGKIFTYWTKDGENTKYYNRIYEATISADSAFTAHLDDVEGSDFAYLDFTNDATTDNNTGAADLNSYIKSDYITSIISNSDKKVYPNSKGGLKLSNSSTSGVFTITLAEGYTATGVEIVDLTYSTDAGKHKLTVNDEEGEFYSATEVQLQSYSFAASNTITVEATKRGYIYTIKITGITAPTPKYDVLFKDGDATLSSDKVDKDAKVTKPTDPEKEGYSFVGWYTENTLQNAYDFNSLVTGNVTLYAKWDINKYQVKFGDAAAQQLEYNSVITAPSTNPTKDYDATNHYVFAGWFDAEDNAFVAGTKATKDVTYTAKFTPIAHVYGEWNTTLEATCTTVGSKTKTCECGHSVTEEISALDHDLVHHEAKAATCTEAGWNAYDTCGRDGCEYTTFVEIPALNHDLVHHDAKAATCTEAGWAAYDTCGRTGCEYTTFVEIPALEHEIHHHDAKAATCTEAGWAAYDTCDREGCEYTTFVEIPALGHGHTLVAEVPATYESAGVKAHYICEGCNKLFVLENEEYVEVSEADLVIPQLEAPISEEPSEEPSESEPVSEEPSSEVSEVPSEDPLPSEKPTSEDPFNPDGIKYGCSGLMIGSLMSLFAVLGLLLSKKRR